MPSNYTTNFTNLESENRSREVLWLVHPINSEARPASAIRVKPMQSPSTSLIFTDATVEISACRNFWTARRFIKLPLIAPRGLANSVLNRWRQAQADSAESERVASRTSRRGLSRSRTVHPVLSSPVETETGCCGVARVGEVREVREWWTAAMRLELVTES